MRISNAKIYYQVNGEWVEIESEYLISLDISEIQATGRAPDARKGTFVNKTYDSIDFKIYRGQYRELDSLYAKDSMYLKIDDGAIITIGKFIVTEKTTISNTSEIEWDVDESVALTRIPKSTGVISGVQDVNVNGTSVVDPDTGVAHVNLVPYAKTEYVEEIAEEARTEIVKLYNEVGKKQDKLTAGENIKIENNVISAKAGGASTTTELKVTEPARESLGGESTIQSAVNIENVNAIKELNQTINEEAARATSEEDRLDGLIDALDATKADREAVTAGLAKKQDILSSKNAGTNITITEEDGIVKINSVGGTEVYYIELSGTSGTLNEKEKAILLSGEPTLNYINKDNMIFKCVFYGSSKAVYSIAGENKNHTIEINLSTGAWKLITYDMQEKLVSGTNIKTINNQSILGAGNIEISGGVSKDYVDKQDESVLETTNNNLASMSEKLTNYIQEVDAKVGQDENGIYIQIGD